MLARIVNIFLISAGCQISYTGIIFSKKKEFVTKFFAEHSNNEMTLAQSDIVSSAFLISLLVIVEIHLYTKNQISIVWNIGALTRYAPHYSRSNKFIHAHAHRYTILSLFFPKGSS